MFSCTLHLAPCRASRTCIACFSRGTRTKGEASEANDFNGTSCITSVSHAPCEFRDAGCVASNIVLKGSLVRSVNAVHCGALLFYRVSRNPSTPALNYFVLHYA